MPFALIIIGLVLVITSARGTLRDLGSLLKNDFTGAGNFFYWLIAIAVIGAIGYNQKAEKFSRSFMALILLAMILSNGGFFSKLTGAIGALEAGENPGTGAAGNALDAAPAPQTPSGPLPAVGGGAGQGGGSGVSSAESAIASATGLLGSVLGGGAIGQITGIASTVGKFIKNPIGGALSVLKGLF